MTTDPYRIGRRGFLGALSALVPAAAMARTAHAAPLGEGAIPLEGSCCDFSPAPAAIYEQYASVATKFGGGRISYFSNRSGADKKGAANYDRRFDAKDILAAGASEPTRVAYVFYGKGSPDAITYVLEECATTEKLQKLKDANLVSGSDDSEMRAYLLQNHIGLDCNGLVFSWADAASVSGFTIDTEPPAYATIKPKRSAVADICVGDIIVYRNVRHVALVAAVDSDQLELVEAIGESGYSGVSKGGYKVELQKDNQFGIYQGSSTTARDVWIVNPGG